MLQTGGLVSPEVNWLHLLSNHLAIINLQGARDESESRSFQQLLYQRGAVLLVLSPSQFPCFVFHSKWPFLHFCLKISISIWGHWSRSCGFRPWPVTFSSRKWASKLQQKVWSPYLAWYHHYRWKILLNLKNAKNLFVLSDHSKLLTYDSLTCHGCFQRSGKLNTWLGMRPLLAQICKPSTCLRCIRIWNMWRKNVLHWQSLWFICSSVIFLKLLIEATHPHPSIS